jgi:hypothetical protein
MVDVSMSSVAPRFVADLRPAADAAATARIDRPPAPLGLAGAVAPTSFAQEGLVAQGLMEPAGPAPVAPPNGVSLETNQAPQRVLRPWGVPMLPDDRREDDAPAQMRTDATGPGEPEHGQQYGPAATR